jgi:hypothetical protein
VDKIIYVKFADYKERQQFTKTDKKFRNNIGKSPRFVDKIIYVKFADYKERQQFTKTDKKFRNNIGKSPRFVDKIYVKFAGLQRTATIYKNRQKVPK